MSLAHDKYMELQRLRNAVPMHLDQALPASLATQP